ncbi:hypothetical protein A3D68_00985 [Candidatus Adlerbacteria bacterium RIFCSPHIGHO2_02_FULL_52_17]|uniref:DUF2262 domain-containing protein n=1 Tax=Candidatus Adlerbacteria bacterium RIFCSPHIGHO2_02_FULL_52_17 TaxID=1797240 RepID=A0A1F4XP53_9BACT|nr:MAG: hypothetical protein A3D68_00985 [Candidatus Adlerbacteria bacterium RIFCSPHIGHO2_02_FULL_52_17]
MTTTIITSTPVISKGGARGGLVAAMDALKLWGACAEGGAEYSMLSFNDAGAFVRLRAAKAGFTAAVEALEYWDAERVPEFQTKWRLDARDAILKAAGHLLAACKEVERSNQADAWFEKHDDVVVFEWQGIWTKGRMIRVEVHFFDQLDVYFDWDTSTGNESTYLSLPSMTDEADKAEGRREGGWTARAAA